MPGKTALTKEQQASIFADLGAGLPTGIVASKYNRTVRTIGLLRQQLRRSTTKAEVIVQSTDWKTELKQLGVSAVRAGLICSDDPYKQADVGVKTLKGLGEFAADDSTTLNLISGMPRDWREQFVITEDGHKMIQDHQRSDVDTPADTPETSKGTETQ